MNHPQESQSCIVIGAGLAGLTAARTLQTQGYSVLVLDKGRGVGGRMATRRKDDARFDHGAQFFTVRSARFAEHIADWLDHGVVTEWSRGFATAEMVDRDDGYRRYRGVRGMTDIAKYLAEGLDVRLEQRVIYLEAQDQRWHVQTESGDHFYGYSLILTPPVPQSLTLLADSGIELPKSTHTTLQSLEYHACIALMAVLEQPSQIPFPGGLQLNTEPIHWIGDNQAKGISPIPSVTIHAAPQFSRQHWDADNDWLARTLFGEAARWVGTEMVSYDIHKWRYSQPIQVYAEKYLYLDNPAPLIFAGDIFGGARIEGAFLSGLSAAEYLISQMQ